MPAADPLYTVRDGHLCFDGADLVELADTRETPFFVFSERRVRANVEAVMGVVPPRAPAHRGLLREQGLLQPVVPRRGAGCRRERRGQRRRRAGQGAGGGVRAAADRLQRRRQDEGRDRARHSPAGVRAFMVDSLHELHRIGEVARDGQGRAPWPRASTCTCPHSRTPASRPRTAARPASTATTPSPRSGWRPAPEHLEPPGMHLHIGSQITSVEPYRQAVAAALDIVAEVEAAPACGCSS